MAQPVDGDGAGSGAGIEPDVAGADGSGAWGLRHAVLAFVIANVAAAIAQVVYISVRGIDELDIDAIDLADLALLQLPFALGMLVVPLVITARLGRGPVRDLGLAMRAVDIPLGLALGVACQVVLVNAITYPVLWLSGKSMEEFEEPARSLTDRAEASGVGGILLLVAIVLVMAPVAEEVLYRGLLQRSLGRSLSTPVTVVVTGIVFGASHLQPLQFPALAAFGAVLAVLAHRSGRLGLPIWTHLGFNATTVVWLLTSA